MKEKQSFVVHICQNDNASWQGQVVWANKNITKNFRSALELIKMIDQAVNSEERIKEERE